MMNAETKIVIPRRYQAPGQPRRRRGIRRSQKPDKKYPFLSWEEFLRRLGVTQADLDAAEELEIDFDDVDGYELED